jgi:hypothetical protein
MLVAAGVGAFTRTFTALASAAMVGFPAAAALMVSVRALAARYGVTGRFYAFTRTLMLAGSVADTTQPEFALLTRSGSSLTTVTHKSFPSAKNMLLVVIHFLDCSTQVVYD